MLRKHGPRWKTCQAKLFAKLFFLFNALPHQVVYTSYEEDILHLLILWV